MQLIDDHGKIFGKLNIIDLCVLLILFFIVIIFIKYALLGGLSDLRTQIETKMNAQLKGEIAIPIDENITLNQIEKEVSLLLSAPVRATKHIKVGIKEDLGYKVIAEVLEVNQLPSNGSSEIIKLNLKIRLLATEINGIYYYNKQPLKISNHLLIRTNLIDLGGTIIDIK